MKNIILFVIFLFALSAFVYPSLSFAQDQNIDSNQKREGVTVERVSEDQALKNFKYKFGYSDKEAKEIIDGTGSLSEVGHWAVIKYYGDENVILEGQAKLNDDNRVLEVAPKINVVDRSGDGNCDIKDVKNRFFTQAGPRSVRFKTNYTLVCGIITSKVKINEIQEIAE